MWARTALLAAFVCAAPAFAEEGIMSAPGAYEAVTAGEMILIDIRSPAEWEQTGVAEGAVALTMHSADFARNLSALLNANQGTPVGMICATGGRTNYVVSLLEKNGFEGVIDVSEGMMGNARGPGWIARRLPLTTAEEAQKAYQTLLE